MRTHKLMLCALRLALVFAVSAANAANPPRLTFKFVSANVPGAVETTPWDINNAGVTVGQYEDSSFFIHGYILNGNQLTTLDDPNGLDTQVSGISYNGSAVVGEYLNTSTGNWMGFLYANGAFTDIPGPAGAAASGASGINDNGAIVGYYTDSSGVTHGFLLQGSAYTTMDVPGAAHTSANGINNAGYVVLGWANASGTYAGSVYNPKTQQYETIKVPGAGPSGSVPGYINNVGDITFAWFEGTTFLTQSALFHDGKFYKSTVNKFFQTRANGINDNNTFVGAYQVTYTSYWAGFRATFQ
jgi:probable HAF family extracellular repeat protein